MPATILKAVRARLLPGLSHIMEAQKDTVLFGAADTEKEITFTLGQAYDAAPIVTASARISENAGAALTKVTRVELTLVDTTQVKVKVEGNAAPGGGEEATVEVHIVVVGKPKR